MRTSPRIQYNYYMAKREIPPDSHEIAKLDAKVRFLYFLSDLGLKSAVPVASEQWNKFASILAYLSVGG